MREQQPIIYDWSDHESPEKPVRIPVQIIKIDDETLRDGLQGTQLEQSITLNEKIIYLELAAPFVDHFDVGYPNSHKNQLNDALQVISHGLERNLRTTYSMAGRAPVWTDLHPMVEIFKQVEHRLDNGLTVRADIFFDSSSRRAKIEGWDREEMLSAIEANIKTLKQHGLRVMYVAEMATITPPNQLKESFERAINAGADVLCIADTTGIADQKAMRNISRWSLEEIGRVYEHIEWDAHCHNHLGLAVANSLTAVEEGFNEVHGTVLWLGEGPGNADNANLLTVLVVKGYLDRDLRGLKKFYAEASDLFGIPIPTSAPVVGRSAHRTSSGIHARAIEKQRETEESGNIYFAYPPEIVGDAASAEIGPSSSPANVRLKLLTWGIIPDDETIENLLEEAKRSGRILSENTISRITRTSIPSELK